MTILVPTDFSSPAQIAIDFATKIAIKLNGEVIFYHCAEDLPKGWRDRQDQEQEKYPGLAKRMQEIREQLQVISKKAQDLGIQNKTLISSGNFLDSLSKTTDEHAIDLIIMGTHGASGKHEYFIGSKTQKVIRKIHRNILAVKEPMEEISFKKVLFATSLGREEKNAFDSFLSFLRAFETKEIHILTIDTPGFISQPRALIMELQEDFRKMAAGYNCTTHFIRNFTVEEGIRAFGQDLGIDLIGISNYQRHPIKRIFSGSNVEMLANHAAVPVLSLDRQRK